MCSSLEHHAVNFVFYKCVVSSPNVFFTHTQPLFAKAVRVVHSDYASFQSETIAFAPLSTSPMCLGFKSVKDL